MRCPVFDKQITYPVRAVPATHVPSTASSGIATTPPPRRKGRDPEKVVSVSSSLVATLNLQFFIGPIDNPAVHNEWGVAAGVVTLIALDDGSGPNPDKGRDPSGHQSAASLQLVAAAALWAIFTNVSDGLNTEQISSVVSLSGGAPLA